MYVIVWVGSFSHILRDPQSVLVLTSEKYLNICVNLHTSTNSCNKSTVRHFQEFFANGSVQRHKWAVQFCLPPVKLHFVSQQMWFCACGSYMNATAMSRKLNCSDLMKHSVAFQKLRTGWLFELMRWERFVWTEAFAQKMYRIAETLGCQNIFVNLRSCNYFRDIFYTDCTGPDPHTPK